MSLASLILSTTPTVRLSSRIHLYGDAADALLAEQLATAIDTHWNAPEAVVSIGGKHYRVSFHTEGVYVPDLDPETVWYNDDPRNYYFRVEDFVLGNISFVDGIGSNTGYFKRDNLLQTSTTVAHEFGHCLGLDHPEALDIRGGQVPGIMHPRGTICDPAYQYDPLAAPGAPGGTLDPRHRQVQANHIHALGLQRIRYDQKGEAPIGGFTSLYHSPHLPGFE